MAALIVQAPEKFRLSGLSLVLLALAIALLLSCVQCGFWARNYFHTPDEATQWWPDYATSPERQERVRGEQRDGYATYRRWAGRARDSYTLGIVLVYLALGTAMVPRSMSPDYWFRVAAAAILLAAAVLEVVWTLYARGLLGRGPHRTGAR